MCFLKNSNTIQLQNQNKKREKYTHNYNLYTHSHNSTLLYYTHKSITSLTINMRLTLYYTHHRWWIPTPPTHHHLNHHNLHALLSVVTLTLLNNSLAFVLYVFVNVSIHLNPLHYPLLHAHQTLLNPFSRLIKLTLLLFFLSSGVLSLFLPQKTRIFQGLLSLKDTLVILGLEKVLILSKKVVSPFA